MKYIRVYGSGLYIHTRPSSDSFFLEVSFWRRAHAFTSSSLQSIKSWKLRKQIISILYFQNAATKIQPNDGMYAGQTLSRPTSLPLCASPGQSHDDLYSAAWITAAFVPAEPLLHVGLVSTSCVPKADAAAPNRPLFQVNRNLNKISVQSRNLHIKYD